MAHTSPNETVAVEVTGALATVTLNRPQSLNALNADMVTALVEVTAGIGADDSIRAVVVTGAGGAFMAGGDLKWFATLVGDEPDKEKLRAGFERDIHDVHPIIVNLRRMPKPVIAAVAGPCAGFGVSLALACDMVLAADDAIFTLAYCHIGTSPDGGSTFHLPRAVGLKRAFEIALLGDRLDAETARQAGMVNRVVPAAELQAATAKLAGRLAAGPTHAYANTKALLNASLDRNLAAQLDAEATGFADCATTGDFAEGLAAFLEKRRPDFTGS